MGEWEGESVYEGANGQMGVRLPVWALEKTLRLGPTMERALSRQHGLRVHRRYQVIRAFHQLLEWDWQVNQWLGAFYTPCHPGPHSPTQESSNSFFSSSAQTALLSHTLSECTRQQLGVCVCV